MLKKIVAENFFATILSGTNMKVTDSLIGKLIKLFLPLAFAVATLADAQTNTAPAGTNNFPSWITRPLPLADALNVALQQNATILKAKNDLEANYGLVVQTRAIVIPKLQATGSYTYTDRHAIENFPGTSIPNQSWNTGLQIVQSIYEGGRLGSAIRAARLTKEQALLNYQTAVADTLLATRIAYYDVLLAEQQIVVNEASVNLLDAELRDQTNRFNAGTVPRFNVLRAEVAVANARPPLIRARNDYRIAKNNLSNLLGYNLPSDVWEDIPLRLTDKLEAEPYQIELPAAIQQALSKRTELGALRKTEQLQRENIINARSGYQPNLQAFAGYGWRNVQFTPPVELGHEIDGWNVGAQLNWNIFDGFLTRGKVIQAKAQYEHAKNDLADQSRQIELQVRTAYSTFIEAKEVLESQQKVQEEADEALRLARARAEAGTGTQLDVLDAETSLTQARTTQIQALHDYETARARLERAIGQDMVQANNK
jgi:outer membrane protein